jgi:hypothetical protein
MKIPDRNVRYRPLEMGKAQSHEVLFHFREARFWKELQILLDPIYIAQNTDGRKGES